MENMYYFNNIGKKFFPYFLVLFSLFLVSNVAAQGKGNDYIGRDSSATWRGEAATRIEQYRKGELKVIAKDANGNVIPNADIQIRMKKHKFDFGCAVNEDAFLNNTTYQQKVLDIFNYVTIENATKMDAWNGCWGGGWQDRARSVINLARQKGLKVRAHNLSWNFCPTNNNTEQAILDYITNVAGDPGIKGLVTDWDVQNEASHNSPVFNTLGRASVLKFFNKAHEVDPNARLFINDAKMEAAQNCLSWTPEAPACNAKCREDFLYNLVKYLKDNGAPLTGVGIESHLGYNLPDRCGWLMSIDSVNEIFNRMASLVDEIQVTEFDMKSERDGWDVAITETPEEESVEADYLRDYLTLAFSQPKMSAFIMWGPWDGNQWRKNSPLYYDNWTLKPSGQRYIDLVKNQWWTNEAGKKTNSSGEYTTRAFLGDYEILINGKVAKVKHYSNLGTTIVANVDSLPEPTSDGTGLRGQYFNTLHLLGTPALTRVDSTVGFDWKYGSPDSIIGLDEFSIRWEGKVMANYSQTYTFYTLSDDGVRLWVNGKKIIDNWTSHPLTEDKGTIDLVEGQKYDIKMEYFERGGQAAAKLLWSSKFQKKEVISKGLLYPYQEPPLAPISTTGWIASSFGSNSTDTPDKAIDNNVATKWSSGDFLRPGQWFIVNMRSKQTFDKLEIDAGSGNVTDYARGYNIYVSNDSISWGEPIASGEGTGRFITISLTPQRARYIKVEQTGKSDYYWWAINEFKVFNSGITPPNKTDILKFVELFPVPAQDVLNVDLGVEADQMSIIVRDLLHGTIRKTFDFNNADGQQVFKLDISNLPNGLYGLKIQTEKGTSVKSFIIHK